MYPNQPQVPPPPTSPTYLDQIAAQPTQATMKPWVLWSLIGGVILLVIIVGMMVMSAGGPSQTDRLKSFIYRVNALQKLADDNAKNIQDSKLLAENAQMSSILTGVSQQSATPLANNGIKKLPEEPKNSPVAAEYAKLATTLDNARLNVVFDRTYSREVTYQLRTLRADITILLKHSRSTSLTTYLKASDANLKPLETEFADFNDGD